jgi:hypothetical protein
VPHLILFFFLSLIINFIVQICRCSYFVVVGVGIVMGQNSRELSPEQNDVGLESISLTVQNL